MTADCAAGVRITLTEADRDDRWWGLSERARRRIRGLLAEVPPRCPVELDLGPFGVDQLLVADLAATKCGRITIFHEDWRTAAAMRDALRGVMPS